MTRINSNSPFLTSPPASISGSEPDRRLIVLVPDLEWDYLPAIHRIWELANTQQARVLLLSLCKDPERELSLRRALVILCAMTQDGRIPVEADVEIGRSWIDVVRTNFQTGDMIVCFAEQRAGIMQKPLSEMLESDLNVPVYILSGLYPQSSSRFNSLSLLLWMGFIGIIVGSFLLQVRIVSLIQGSAQTTLMIFTVMAEIWLISFWNDLFN